MRSEQLEQILETAIASARLDPQDIDLLALWQTLEPALPQLPQMEQLHLAGTIFSQLAELYWTKANSLLDDWEEAHDPAGPVPTDLLLTNVRIRQSQQVDFSDLVRSPSRTRSASTPVRHEETVVEAVEKTKVLAMIDQIETVQDAIAVAHAEDVSAWQTAIAHYLNQQSAAEVSLDQIREELSMPLVQIWLGLLLGNFMLQQRGSFYDPHGIWLGCPE